MDSQVWRKEAEENAVIGFELEYCITRLSVFNSRHELSLFSLRSKGRSMEEKKVLTRRTKSIIVFNVSGLYYHYLISGDTFFCGVAFQADSTDKRLW